MKHVVVSVGKDYYEVDSLGDDLKPLSDELEAGIMLAVVMDRMIGSGYSKKLIDEIVDAAYESRL